MRSFAVAVAVTCLSVFLVWRYGYRLAIRYEEGDGDLRVRLIGQWTLKRIPYAEIVGVAPVSFWSAAWPIGLRPGDRGRKQWNIANRLVGKRVAVTLRDGTVFILTPSDPGAFVHRLTRPRELLPR